MSPLSEPSNGPIVDGGMCVYVLVRCSMLWLYCMHYASQVSQTRERHSCGSVKAD